MSKIQVSDNTGDLVLIDDDLASVNGYLNEACSVDYADQVRAWFQGGAAEPLIIGNFDDTATFAIDDQVFDTWKRVIDDDEKVAACQHPDESGWDL